MTLLPFDTYNVVVLISITWMHGMWISGLLGHDAGIQTDARDLKFGLNNSYVSRIEPKLYILRCKKSSLI